MNIEFGAKVLVRARLNRIHDGHKRFWRPFEPVPGPVIAIFLGPRTISDGGFDEVEEYDWEYVPARFFHVALVCDGPRTNPYYALPKDVEAVK